MQCPACNKLLQGEFNFCPHCGGKINKGCINCGKSMMPEWVACPCCGYSATQQMPQYSPGHKQYPQNQHHYHSNSSGGHHRRKKGLLGSFFSG